MPKDENLVFDPVDNYPEVKTEVRSREETLAAEGRLNAVDEIEDYHTQNPTLVAEGPQFDPDTVPRLRQERDGKAVARAAKVAAKEEDTAKGTVKG